jgi:hypothetical protein
MITTLNATAFSAELMHMWPERVNEPERNEAEIVDSSTWKRCCIVSSACPIFSDRSSIGGEADGASLSEDTRPLRAPLLCSPHALLSVFLSAFRDEGD